MPLGSAAWKCRRPPHPRLAAGLNAASAQHLNGKRCVVEGFDAKTGRYRVTPEGASAPVAVLPRCLHAPEAYLYKPGAPAVIEGASAPPAACGHARCGRLCGEGVCRTAAERESAGPKPQPSSRRAAGLKAASAQHLNGKRCVVEEFDTLTGRYRVTPEGVSAPVAVLPCCLAPPSTDDAPSKRPRAEEEAAGGAAAEAAEALGLRSVGVQAMDDEHERCHAAFEALRPWRGHHGAPGAATRPGGREAPAGSSGRSKPQEAPAPPPRTR